MIGDFFFFVKMLLLTCFVVMALQVRIGEKTLEARFDGWVKNSILVDYIQESIDGGLALVKTGYGRADANIHFVMSKISRKHVKNRNPFHFSWKRHNDREQGAESGTLHVKAQTPDPE